MFRHESGSNTLMSFLLGGLTGASLAVLLAPQSGAETRGQIRTRGREVARKGRELGARVAERSREKAPSGTSSLPEPAVTTPPPARQGLV
jgi:gas vesicle protein